MDAHAQTDADDRTHEWGNEHGADDHGRRIGVEPERSYEDGQHKDYDVGAAERHIVTYRLFGLSLRQKLI